MNTNKQSILLSLALALTVLLSACSSGGISGAFGTSAPSKEFQAITTAPTPRIAQEISGNAVVDPRIIQDMRELANYRGDDVYRIGTSDLLSIKVFQANELSGDVRVDQGGNISLPLVGGIRIAGLTQAEAEKRLANLLGANLLQNPQVSIFIKEYTNQRVTVEGEVKKQGVFPLRGQVTILQAIALAGGLSDKARTGNVALFRKQGNGTRTYYVSLDLIRKGQANDPFIVNNDRIVIQKMRDQRVTVEGEVKRPGVFTFNEPTTVLQAIAMSQGLTPMGAPNRVILFRRGQGESTYGIDLSAIRQGSTPDPYVQGGDRIVVHRSNSRYWLEQAKTLISPLRLLGVW